jgi:peroxiredoxin
MIRTISIGAGLVPLAVTVLVLARMGGPTPVDEGRPAPAPAAAGALGCKIAPFTLRDFRGQPWSLAGLSDRKLVVVVFLGSTCPLANLYGPRLTELAREFGPRGVAFVGISANAQDTLADLAAFVRRHRLPFPLLKDPAHAVADQMGAVRTPETFVLDAERIVRYRGRIDDQYGVGSQRPRPAQRYLASALDELLSGRPVSCPSVPAVGCRIGREPKVEPHGTVTYGREISRLLARRCVSCHRAGDIAPFPLTDYREVAGWSAMIREVVSAGRMPPWFADPRHGRFRNEARLTPEEKSLLVNWIDDGCPAGSLADQPAAATFPKAWRIGRPDRILPIAMAPFTIPAEGEVAYQYFLVDPGFAEDRFVRAAQVRPRNLAVVHHALVSIVPPDGDMSKLDSAGAMLDYAPGMPPTELPAGYAIRIRAGSKLLFQIHYTPNGSPQTDLTRLGLVFAEPHAVQHEVRGGAVINPELEIPAGAAHHQVAGELRLAEGVRLVSLSPHMHLRGKSFRFEAVFPDGRHTVLLDVPRYDFNWQLRYEPAEPPQLPAGTRLICTAVYDNSADNPANPDPTATVGWGDQTWDEMLIGFFAFVPDRAGPRP